jgi:hypothetical protein
LWPAFGRLRQEFKARLGYLVCLCQEKEGRKEGREKEKEKGLMEAGREGEREEREKKSWCRKHLSTRKTSG